MKQRVELLLQESIPTPGSKRLGDVATALVTKDRELGNAVDFYRTARDSSPMWADPEGHGHKQAQAEIAQRNFREAVAAHVRQHEMGYQVDALVEANTGMDAQGKPHLNFVMTPEEQQNYLNQPEAAGQADSADQAHGESHQV
jgi:hypothetical protein